MNAQAAGPPNRQQGPPLYRPENMRNITLLGEEEKIKYEKGLTHLWKQHDSAAPGSPEQIEAKRKIGEFGKMLVAKMQQLRQQHQNQQVQAQQAQQQQKQRPHQPIPSGQAASQSQPTQAAQSGPSNLGNTSSQAPATASQSSPNPNAPPQPARTIPHQLISHLNEMVFRPPPNVPDKAKWVDDIKQRYAKAIYTMESARNGIRQIEHTLENTSPSPEERKKIEERKMQLQKQQGDAMAFASLVRKQYGSGGNQRTTQNGGAVPNAGNQGRPQGVAQPGQGMGNGAATIAAAAAAAANPMQSSAAAVNAAIEAAKKQQVAAGRMPGVNAPTAHPHQSQAQAPGTPAQAQPSPVTQATPAQPAIAQHQPQQPQQAQKPPPPIKIEPGAQPLPAPLNTAMASSAAGMQSAGTPTQNSARIQTPQSATPATANANIPPLTHAAAVNLASQQRAGAMPGAPATGATPASNLGVMGAGQQPGHPHAHPPQTTAQTNLQSKLPIPKVLHDKAAQMPQPVPSIGGIGSGRPTYSGGGGIGGGVMNQPALPKTPAYQLEGEGERVLNKKKLDELVRQVCGGTAEGQEGNLLTPEVEESVLNMADAFVDNVLHQACRNAKERGSKVLEIRDIQLVLERTYNIRIPGYSSEELRTVRKVQPNSSWIKKMSAVQAAKVVPGKGDL
ncbi:Transcription initiation factor TFIID subunit 12 [Madurella mycetomatis]|nr:Transcription initiation factor TFIID subunit 12 [Madurella mycetomatis]